MSDDNADSSSSDSASTPAIGGVEVRQHGYSLYLKIPDSRLECRCSYVPHEQGSMMTRDELTEILTMSKVLEGIDREACDSFAINAAAGRPQADVLLAVGTPPVDGADEFFVQTVPSSTMIHSGEADDDEGRVDMYLVQTFVNVYKDEEIGRFIPATPGTPGRNISGQPIAPRPGKPLKKKIGKNARTGGDGMLLIAAATGRFCQVGGEFSVEEEFIVNGDVNFKTGIIDFKGFVEVHGDVLDRFNITATKGLTVTGNIGACNIVSDGDVTFCGMDGEEKGSIRCGGTLRAHHIHDTYVECAGDVLVEVEIHNCHVRTLGRIIVNKDTISAGSYIALGGIEAGKLGSASARHTNLLVGVDYRHVEEMKTMLDELAETHCLIREARSLDEITELRKRAAEFSERIETIRSNTLSAANAKINVKGVLHENVRIGVGDVTQTVNEELNGPITIVENIIDGGLRFIPMTGLDVRAVDIEAAFARDKQLALLAAGEETVKVEVEEQAGVKVEEA